MPRIFFVLLCLAVSFSLSALAQDGIEVNGNLKVTGQGSQLVFPDGSTQGTAILVGPMGPQGPAGESGPNIVGTATGSSFPAGQLLCSDGTHLRACTETDYLSPTGNGSGLSGIVKAGKVIYVDDYVTCDGTTDTTIGLQSAANAAAFGQLVFPRNATCIASSIVLPNGTQLVGNGATLKQKANTNNNLLHVSVNNTIDGLIIDQNRQNQSQGWATILVWDADASTIISNNAFINTSLAIQVHHTTGKGIRIEGNRFVGVLNERTNYGVFINTDAIVDGVISNNLMDMNNSWTDGIAFRAGTRNLIISNNIAKNSAVNADNSLGTTFVYASESAGLRENVTISGNIIENMSGNGIDIAGDANNLIISNNLIRNSRSCGIGLFHVNAHPTNVLVSGNIITNSGIGPVINYPFGICIDQSDKITVNGNTITDMQTVKTQTYGIGLVNAPTNITITNNNLVGNASGAINGSGTNVVRYLNQGDVAVIPSAYLGSGAANSTTFLRGDGTYAVPGGGGTITSVSSANTDIAVTSGTTTPVLTLNSGTGANQIVKLTAAGMLPAVDGSQLTGLNNAIPLATTTASGLMSATDKLQSSAMATVQLLSFISPSEWPAIASCTSTFDASSAFAAAIRALPSSGGKITLPEGCLNISAVITVGNGTAASNSTINNITLEGKGSGLNRDDSPEITVNRGATTIKWTGPQHGTMINVTGPISGVKLKGLLLDCNGLADQGINMHHAYNHVVEDVTVTNYLGYAGNISANATWGAAPKTFLWEHVKFVNPGTTTANGLSIALTGGNVSGMGTFNQCQFQRGNAATATSINIGYADHLIFNGVLANNPNNDNTGTGVRATVPAAPNNGWPTNITFVGSSLFGGVGISGAWNTAQTYPAFFFLPYYNADLAPVPPSGKDATGNMLTLPRNFAQGFTENGTSLGSQGTLKVAVGTAGDFLISANPSTGVVTLDNQNVVGNEIDIKAGGTTVAVKGSGLSVNGAPVMTGSSNTPQFTGLGIATASPASGMHIISGNYAIPGIGAPDPNVADYQVTPTKHSVSIKGHHNESSVANLFQVQTISRNFGTSPNVPLFSEAVSDGPNSSSWGFNSGCYNNSTSGTCIGYELNFGNLVNGGTAYGLVVNPTGYYPVTSMIQIQSGSPTMPNTYAQNGIIFNAYTQQPVANSLVTTIGQLRAVNGIDFSGADFTGDAFKLRSTDTIGDDLGNHYTLAQLVAGSGGTNGTVTQVNAGSGLTGGPITTVGTLSVNFAGSGTATTVARSDHTHATSPQGRITVSCTNASTDASVINSAISSSSIGDEIVIDGPCLINATIVLLGDRSYRGQSKSTVLKQANNANLTALLASDSFVNNTSYTGNPVTIHNLTLDGNKANNSQTTDGLVIRSWLTKISDLTVMNCHGNGIRLTNLSANGTPLVNTQVNGRISDVFVTDSDDCGIMVQDTGNSLTDWYLLDNWIAYSGNDGIHMENAAGWVIERNHVYGVGKTALFADRLFSTSIADNYIEDFGQSLTTGTYYGINMQMQGDTGSTIYGNRIFNFQDEVSGSTYRYLGISQVNYNSAEATVFGNLIRGKGATGTGLYFSKGGGTALNVISTGNNVTGVATQRYVGTGVTLGAGL